MKMCESCINFEDTGHAVDGWCACYDHFVLRKDKSCYNFEGDGNDMGREEVE